MGGITGCTACTNANEAGVGEASANEVEIRALKQMWRFFVTLAKSCIFSSMQKKQVSFYLVMFQTP